MDKFTMISARALSKHLFLVGCCALLSGCLGIRLQQLEIRQLEGELAGIRDISTYLATSPQLGGVYQGRAFVRGDVFNRFLAGLDRYKIQLEEPAGAVIHIDQVRLEFRDGPPVAIINARAIDRSGQVELKLRLRSDIIVGADDQQSALTIRFAVREIVPDVRLSIFRIREWWFAGQILRLAAQDYIDTLPTTVVPLDVDLPIDVAPSGPIRIDMDHGHIDANLRMPHFRLHYQYKVLRALTLSDGVHVFFTLHRIQ